LEGGFLIKFTKKDKEEIEKHRCYKISFDYDMWKYSLNNEQEKSIPDGITKIEVVPE
jgi:hypothetical protein